MNHEKRPALFLRSINWPMLIAFVFALFICAAFQARAADGASSALPSDLAGVPLEWQVRIGFAMIALKYLAEAYSAVRNGGGLKRIIMAFWFGENLPKVVASDYKQELTTPPFPKDEKRND